MSTKTRSRLDVFGLKVGFRFEDEPCQIPASGTVHLFEELYVAVHIAKFTSRQPVRVMLEKYRRR